MSTTETAPAPSRKRVTKKDKNDELLVKVDKINETITEIKNTCEEHAQLLRLISVYLFQLQNGLDGPVRLVSANAAKNKE